MKKVKKKKRIQATKAKRQTRTQKLNRKRKAQSRQFETNRHFEPWVPKWKTVTIAGRKIRGMVYVVTPQRFGLGSEIPPGFIDPTLPVAKIGDDFLGDEIDREQGRYDCLSPTTRATYLDWLTDRESLEYSTNYVFMYFCGLETRFFIDESSRTEKKLILTEIQRLLEIYGYDGHIKQTFTYFVGIARLLLGLRQEVEQSQYKWHHPNHLSVFAEIGKKADAGIPLDGLSVFNALIVDQENVPGSVSRIFSEFKAMFISLFNEKYPNGMKIDEPQEELYVYYTPLGIGEIVDLNSHIGDVGDVRYDDRLFEVASDIAGEAQALLASFIRLVRKYPERRQTLDAHLLLPEQIRAQFPNQAADRIIAWAKKVISKTPVIRFNEVNEAIQFKPGENLTVTQTKKVIDMLAALHIKLVPDPRLTKYNLKGGDLVIVSHTDETMPKRTEISDTYWSVFRQLAIVCFIIQGNDGIVQSDVNILRELTRDSKIIGDLEENELSWLIDNSTWMLQVTPTLPMLRQNLKVISSRAKRELAPLALKAAVVDNHVPAERIEAVKKIYKLLELDAADVYSDLHSQSLGGSVVIDSTRRTQQVSDGRSRGGSGSMVELDSERIESVLSDTVRVSATLGEIFESDDKVSDSTVPDDSDSMLPGLDREHALLALELIQRSYWEDEEFEQLVSRFSLMPAGAIEILNEWSFDNFQEPLIEEYDGYNLNSNMVEKLETL